MNQGWQHDGEKPSSRHVSMAGTGETRRGRTARGNKTLWACLLLAAWFSALGSSSAAPLPEDETGHASLVWVSADKDDPTAAAKNSKTGKPTKRQEKPAERTSHVYFTPRPKQTEFTEQTKPRAGPNPKLPGRRTRVEPRQHSGKVVATQSTTPSAELRRLRRHEFNRVPTPMIPPQNTIRQPLRNLKPGSWQPTVMPNAPRRVAHSILRDNPFRKLLKPGRAGISSVRQANESDSKHTGRPQRILQTSGTQARTIRRGEGLPGRDIPPPPRDADMQLRVDLAPVPTSASATPPTVQHAAPNQQAPSYQTRNRQTPYIRRPGRIAARNMSRSEPGGSSGGFDRQPANIEDPAPKPNPKNSLVAGLRLPHLPELPSGMGVPRPTTETREKYSRFVIEENDPDNTLTLVVGRPKVLRFREAPLRTYLPESGSTIIAMRYVEPEAGTHVAIEPLQTGSTVMSMWFRDEDAPGGQHYLSWLVTVVEDPERGRRLEAIYASLENEINRNFPDSVVRLSLVGDKLLVRGQAKDIEDATQILRVIGANAPGGVENVALRNVDMNLVSQLNPDGGNAFDDGALQSLMLRTAEKDAVEAGSTVINMLRVAGEQQVMLKVIVAEVNRNALRAIGARMSAGSTDVMSAFAQSGAGGSINSSILAAEGGTFGVNHGDFQLTLNALRRLGYAKTLAEPNVVSLNGQAAVFRAGDTFPVPAASVGSNGAVGQSVAQQFVGVQIQFLPVVTDKDRVRLQLAGTVSALDNSLGASVGGSNIPGTSTRNFFTTVEMREGQTLALAGLISASSQAESSRTPFAGDIPVIGRLFNTDSVAAQEQELLILVTPQMVHPLDSEETLPLPGSDLFEPDDLDFYFHGRLEGNGINHRSAAHTSLERIRARRRAEKRLIIGPTGYSDW